MKKSELIKALANVSDDTEILFGSPKEESLGSISSKSILPPDNQARSL